MIHNGLCLYISLTNRSVSSWLLKITTNVSQLCCHVAVAKEGSVAVNLKVKCKFQIWLNVLNVIRFLVSAAEQILKSKQ